MARAPRIDYPGAWHHVMHRGARSRPIFTHQAECEAFLDHLGTATVKTGIEVHAFALMPNHCHLLVRSPQATLSRAMQSLNGRYTQWFNHRKGWDGPLFRGRFRSAPIEAPDQLNVVFAYIHLNPLRAHLIRRLGDHSQTSHRAYLGRIPRPEWLQIDHFSEVFGGPTELHAFVKAVHQGAHPWPDDLDRESGFPLIRLPEEGDIDHSTVGTSQTSLPHAEAVLERVQEITDASRRALMQTKRGRGANPARRLAAWALSHETKLTRVEVGEVLKMSPAQVVRLLHHLRKGGAKEPLATWIAGWSLPR